MKPLTVLKAAVALAMAFSFVTMSSCKRKTAIPVNPEFAQYVAAFTSGTISAASTVRIRFTDVFVENIDLSQPIKEKLMDISPSVEGELWWVDQQTIEFRPINWLQQGEIYEVEFQLGKIANVPDHLKEFNFSFSVMRQHMTVEVQKIGAYRNDDLTWMSLTGKVTTMDVCQTAELEKTITATESKRVLSVTWQHEGDPHIHYFTIDSIERKDIAQNVEIKWSGESIGADQKSELSQEIPALGDFKVFFFTVTQQPEQFVILQFSDPLLPNQNLDGLIEISGVYGSRYTIENNEVRIYPPYRLSGDRQITIHPGVRNIMDYKSSEEQVVSVRFEEMKPEIKLPDQDKVILPSTDGLVFPFEAVNLSAVDVKIIRVFESNVPQFLQINELSGEQEMRRVGRQVAKKTVQLNQDGKKDLSIWNTFFLDLDKIIKTEQGAIYRVELGFKKAYSLYHCMDEESHNDDEDNMSETEVAWDEASEDDQSNWDYYEDYYGDYYDDYYDWDYDYDQRDNPCNAAYYKSRRPEGKNIFASDLGIIAKKGTDNSMLVALSDIKSTKPIADAEIEILNYQQQILAKVKTGSDGKVNIPRIEGTPFLLVAKKGSQRGYMKLDGGHALSVSTFDVSGQHTEKGLKGFIYGERGIWRPGDTLFLSFILEDEQKILPAGHPVNFELVNPRGQVVKKMVRSKGENGFYRFTTWTDADAETGNYLANVRVGGATFSKSIKIETVKPNRLKINFDFGKEKITAVDKDLIGNLQVKWLHGAVAKNLNAQVSATFTQGNTTFDRYSDYEFDDPVRSFSSEEQIIFSGKVDAEGLAKVSMKVDLKDRAPGVVNANFSVKVFEEGGDFSTDRFSIPYAPYSVFTGIKLPKGDKERGMLLTDTNHKIECVTVNAQGTPVARKNLQWKLYKVQWRWWWESSNDDLSNYVGSESTTAIASGTMNTGADGKGSFVFQVKYPDWGRYLIRVEDPEGGHATGKAIYIDWPGWAGRAQRENPGGASMLTFSTDKAKYTTGEECKVTFPSSGSGRALISIESGTKVLESHWVEAKKDQTTFSFKTTPEMTPNAYINITLVQPHNQTANDLPIRLYGIMPVFVENPASHLQPVITMKDELAPEKEFEVKVSEKTGKAMTYTLAIVDEGLLDLTRFKTPDPWNYFYAREALGVNTYDVYDQVIGAYGSKLSKLLSLGGDEEGSGKAKSKANRFKPVVMYAGPFTIAANQSKTTKFNMPNYIGSVRVMVVAGKDPAYGNAEKAVPVKKPLMVLASLPRVLGPGEEVKLPVTVFAMDKAVKEVVVKVEPNDLLVLNKAGTQTIKFSQPGDEVINFPMKVAEKIGIGKVKVTVTSGKFHSTYEVELDVRNPNPYVTNVSEGIVDAGQSWTGMFDQAGMNGTNTTILEVSSIPPVDFGRRLKYLLDYPHGCVEQTTSGAFPQVFLADVVQLSEVEKQRATDNVKLAINKLVKFQNRNGGFAYWPGENTEDDWCTSYVGHFLLEAKARSFSLPSGMESSWLSYQKNAALNWRPQTATSGNYYWRESGLVQAYRLYTLALAGKPEIGAMNRLKETPGIEPAAKWRLAAAYALASQMEVAKQLVKNLTTAIPEYRSMSYTYGDNWRDEAMIIETLVLIGEKTKAASLVKDLSARLSSQAWLSTQSTAYGLLAISKFAAKSVGTQIKYKYVLNDKTSPEQLTDRAVIKNDLNAKMKGNKIVFNNTSKILLYARVINTGQPLNGDETPAENGIKISVKYTDINGTEVDVTEMEQGTDFLAEVTVVHAGLKQKYDELALTQIFPSGWEIINSRLEMSAGVIGASAPDYQDFRDDRVFSYFDLYPLQTRKFVVKLNATYLGRYYLPAVNCEAMYDNTINGRTRGQWVEVVQSGGNVAMK